VLSDTGDRPEVKADILLKEGRFSGTKDREVMAQNMANHHVIEGGIVTTLTWARH